MSVNARLNSHLNESSPVPFHSGVGSVHPIGLRVKPPRGHTEDASDTDDLTMLAVLLQDRHLWLQHVGTGAGMFGSVLMELQSASIATGVPLGELRSEDLPLLRQEHRFRGPLGVWERLEATRRHYFGCRPGDLEVLTDYGRDPLRHELADMVDQVIAPDVHDMTGFQVLRAELANQEQPRGATIRNSGWSVGARHLMQGAARQTDVFRLMLTEVATSGEFVMPSRYDGGVARAMFEDVVPIHTAAAEVGFAFACDLALNCLSPPLFPFPPYNPGVYFGHVVQGLATFRFDRSLDVTDPAAVRALLAELTEHAGDDLVRPARLKRDMITRFLGHLWPDVVAGQLFTLSADDLPVPTGPSPLARYKLALSAHAERLRAEAPELFVFPAVTYLADRDAFLARFEQVQPPLLVYDDAGAVPTRRLPGWLEFFLAAGVRHEVLCGIVMHDVPSLAVKLAPYVRSVFGQEHGMAVVRQAVQGVLRGAPVADDLLRATTAQVEPAGPQ